MHFVISTTWGPTDPTRAMLPFIFAASAIRMVTRRSASLGDGSPLG
jgi:predicted peroxiredoxin